MKRKDLYVEIYNTVLTEVHIADRDTLTEILESLSIYPKIRNYHPIHD